MTGLQNAIDLILQQSNAPIENSKDDIAIIGVDFQLPSAHTFSQLDIILRSGIDQIYEPSDSRKELMTPFLEHNKSYQFVPAAYIENIDKFDYPFFKLTKKEAQLMDPYQRLFLETAWRAFEDAGLTEQQLKGSKIGVFVGQPQQHSYFDLVKRLYPEDALMAGPGNINSVIASRISYLLDLKGPSMMVDTACSSSLTALNEACLNINNKICDTALVGGINLLIPSVMEEGEVLPDIISPSFRARTFSDDSDGTGIGECIAAIVIKPLKDAKRDKDNIYAVIKGIHMNNDGKSLGLTAPNRSAQKDVVTETWRKAGIKPADISYIEAHGTGTELGDPIELSALTDAFRSYTNKNQFCAIGSTKTVFGHTDSAAGIVGILKCLISLKNKRWYPNTNFIIPNRKFDFLSSPFFVIDQSEQWVPTLSKPKLCAISSFGLSGTNCHVILEEHIVDKYCERTDHFMYLFPLSAKTHASLVEVVKGYIEFLENESEVSLEDLCYTAQLRRNHYMNRIVILFDSYEDLIKKLLQCCEELTKLDGQVSRLYPGNIQGEDIGENLQSEHVTSEMIRLIKNYLSFQIVNWDSQGHAHCISLPTYGFEQKSVWLSTMDNKNLIPELPMKKVMKKMEVVELQNKLQLVVSKIFGVAQESVPIGDDLLKFGFDSITIVQLKRELQTMYGVDIPLDAFFTELNTIEKLSEHIAPKVVVESLPEPLAEEPREQQSKEQFNTNGLIPSSNQSVIDLFNRQLDIIQEQIKTMSYIEKEVPQSRIPTTQTSKSTPKVALQQTDTYSSRFLVKNNSSLTEQQQVFLNELIPKFNRKFKTSKDFLQENKEVWANGRFSQGYSKTWENIVIPIFADEANGIRMKDIDGNTFIDFCMGFGVNLFGYNHPMIHEAISSEMDKSLILGPLTADAAEVSALIKKATGVERLAYCNSGTEAIMNLIRIARSVTEKSEIIIFKNSYHGTFDGIYVSNSGIDAIPLSLGTLQSMVQHVKVFEYGNSEVFDYITENADRVALVLVEPIQSRNPDLQPKLFLQKLRSITRDHHVLYAFDEIITGFRLALGGSQQYYNVEADLVAYGKVIGGGLPIGIFGGKAEYMAAVDGGVWNAENMLTPYRAVIQTGGTFCHHPLSMKAAKVVLNYLVKDKGRLQKRLNFKTKVMAEFMNWIFTENNIALHISVGGSQFIFSSPDPTLMRFLYYMMLYSDIYIWEGGTCYLSDVHSDEDIAELVVTVLKNLQLLAERSCINADSKFQTLILEQLREQLMAELIYEDEIMQYFPHGDADKLKSLWSDNNIEFITPVTPMQNLMIAQNINGRRNGNDVSFEIFSIEGNIDSDCLQKACTATVKRNPVLRSEYRWRKLSHPAQITYYVEDCNYNFIDATHLIENEKNLLLQKIKDDIKKAGFNDKISKIEFILIKLAEKRYELCLFYLNSLFDGWSSNNLFSQIITNYEKRLQNRSMLEDTDDSYIQYALQTYQADRLAQKEFWKQEFVDFVMKAGKQEQQKIYENSERVFTQSVDEAHFSKLKQFASANKVSIYALIQAAWAILQQQIMQQDEVIIGVVTSGRNNMIPNISESVGLFTNILPLRIKAEQICYTKQYITEMNHKILQIMDHENVTVYDIAEYADVPMETLQQVVESKTLVLLNFPEENESRSEIRLVGKEESSNLNVPLRIYIEVKESLEFICRYNHCAYNEEHVKTLVANLIDTITKLANSVE
ncbi:aminotransferase class III-fold pyridoxal phosphate-dependent enzyme [Paenibacillus polymyxa]|uniref:aminotransferase class III-fold pyridoxal phosphate-dependent enzyme n=1 Tax=Paenibacillus polymyxa TaxID=1406 RepID=UPI002ED0C29C|nr:aminotransferase class III-fold pyridoxal phosphate-dependent enzyme [Paenibacillus polymyxa]